MIEADLMNIAVAAPRHLNNVPPIYLDGPPEPPMPTRWSLPPIVSPPAANTDPVVAAFGKYLEAAADEFDVEHGKSTDAEAGLRRVLLAYEIDTSQPTTWPGIMFKMMWLFIEGSDRGDMLRIMLLDGQPEEGKLDWAEEQMLGLIKVARHIDRSFGCGRPA